MAGEISNTLAVTTLNSKQNALGIETSKPTWESSQNLAEVSSEQELPIFMDSF